MSLHPTYLRRCNVIDLDKPANCPECKEVHGKRQTRDYPTTNAFFSHYTKNHALDDEKRAFLRREIEAFQESEYSQFHEFLKRARIE